MTRVSRKLQVRILLPYLSRQFIVLQLLLKPLCPLLTLTLVGDECYVGV